MSFFRRYREKIEKAKELYEAAVNFEEGERVPIMVEVSGLLASQFVPGLSGYNYKDYYRNLDVQRKMQIEGIEWSLQNLDTDVIPDPEIMDESFDPADAVDTGIIREGVIWDCDNHLPDDEHPWATPWTIPRLNTPEDMESIEVPDPVEVQEKFRKQLKKQFGRDFTTLQCAAQGPKMHPPFSAAGALIGMNRLYVYVYEYPKVLKGLLDKLMKTKIVLHDYYDELRGEKTESLGLQDDHAGFLPRKQYLEFVMPYNKRLFELYGKKHRVQHMDSKMSHIADILADEYKANEINGEGVIELDKIKPFTHGKTVIRGSAVLPRYLMPGTSYEKIKELVDYSMRSAAPGGGYLFGLSAILPGIDNDRFLFLTKYAKKAGRYPIKVD